MNVSFVLMLANMLASPFHFRDCVVVTKGFYEGCQGRVQEEISSDPIKYDVALDCKDYQFNVLFSANELKKCKK